MTTKAEIYSIPLKTIDGSPTTLEAYRGKVMLIVNVASKCGFTPQYEGLEALYKKYQAQGFAVLGFPCNQIGKQEPGNSAEIKKFCSLTYDVSFPLFDKIEVNGAHTHPLYGYLKKQKPGALGMLGMSAIKWNFTKFLIDKQGQVVGRYAPTVKPEALEKVVRTFL